MAGAPVDGDVFNERLSSIAFGEVMAAAARDYQKEVLETEKGRVAARQAQWQEFDLDSLAEDPELERLHAQRLVEMKKETERRQALRQKGHGEYTEITEEQFLEEVTGSERVVAHFFHREFVRCRVMDKHLAQLAPKYVDTKFIKVDGERCPFFVAKLQVKVLPCLVCFRDGVAVDRVVGFDELGGGDDFSTRTLENRLERKGAIVAIKQQGGDRDDSGRTKRNLRSSTWESDSDSS